MHTTRAFARFSPGPWWGFNGVDELVVTDATFIRTHLHVFGGQVPSTYPLSTVQVLSSNIGVETRSGEPRWAHLTVILDGRKRSFTGQATDGMPFIEALTAATLKHHNNQ